ncbi:nocturnin isoform X2 [Lutzomyia longipalpis]|uniref:nocturnin isoform X2 n=1 Tax=Lutzomyia longipalpis TaxID=7200 RepID=UPI0024839FF2|nr:nocturnin isoform X2 [Lutzomyia longipalpis]
MLRKAVLREWTEKNPSAKGDRKTHLQKVALQRMGSFNSSPKFNNEDNQDDDVEIPSGLTTSDLVHHCRMMRGDQRPQLLTRYFLNPTDRSFGPQDLTNGMRVLNLDAVSKICSAPVSSPQHIRVLQWNVLSQSLGEKNDGFVNCPDEALTWECRKYQIVQEIIQNDPDVVCLQEVDHFKFLQMTLGSQNYEGVFFPKPDSPCLYVQSNNGPDGCAIFYKKNKFDLVTYATRVLQVWRVQSNQVAIAAILRVRQSGREVCVGTTHLKARHSALLSKLRNEQGKDLMRFVAEVAAGRPVILSGDFNAEPVEPVYSTILNYVPLGLASAYADALDAPLSAAETSHTECHRDGDSLTRPEISARHEPPYTTWKIREDGEVCHTIDYVFYSKEKMKVNNCLMFPQDNEIGKDRVPSFQYPSDHFSLVCDFEFLDSDGAV